MKFINQKGISSIVIILIIVGVLVVAGWIYWRYHPSFFCLKEGESGFGPRTWFGKECCYGLKSGYVFRLINGKCTPVTDVGVCINCSNGQCGPGEDKCNCPEDCAEPDETIGWKTYRNEEYGFEIKYPANWGYLDNLKPGINYDEDASFYVLFDDKNPAVNSAIFIAIYDIPKYKKGLIAGTQKQVIKISGVDGYKYTRKQALDIGGHDIVITVELPKEDKIFNISYISNFNEKSYENIFNQILPTFKFIK